MMRGMFVLLCVLAGCEASKVELSVELRTDLVPGVEFTSSVVSIDGALVSESPFRIGDAVRNNRIAEVSELSPNSQRLIKVELLDVSGTTVAQTIALVDNREDSESLIIISRSCLGVTCADLNGGTQTCLAGKCVDPECVLSSSPGCPAPECLVATDCASPTAPCLFAECSNGVCTYPQEESSCGLDQYCESTLGCTFANQSPCGECADSNPCTRDVCDVASQVCEYSPVADDADCLEGVCRNGACVSSNPTCADGVLNADETDVDCGGSNCPMCSDGQSCLAPSDCASGTCTGFECASPTCMDGVTNGSESDLDCGGDCVACTTGQTCSSNADCDSASCSTVCAAPSCEDGILNQDETQVDCGGACAACVFSCSAVTTIPESECDALVALYNATQGTQGWANFRGWLSDIDPCTWFAVTCDGGHVTDLNPGQNFIRGTLPAELGQLSMLTRLNLGQNTLTGEIPEELGNLSQLRILSLGSNSLSGSIPPSFGQLTEMRTLLLHGNDLSGPIPPELGNMVQLQVLFLYRNELSGPIPTELGNLTALTQFELQNNDLSGGVPDSLGALTSATIFRLGDNQLRGAVNESITSIPAIGTDFTIGSSRSCLVTDNNRTTRFLNERDTSWRDGC